MFDRDDQGSSVEVPSIDDLPCLVKLPPGWLERYGAHTAPMDNDKRRFPRIPCGALETKAALEYRTTLPSRPRDELTFAIYPASISRGGIAFLHYEPLYPCESFRIRFRDGRACEVEVARCRKVGDRCFEIGARF